MWKKLNIQVIERTKNYFHITSTIASNFNQSKIWKTFDGSENSLRLKKAFWKHYERENAFCKKSRNLSSVGSDFSLKCLNFPKNAWNFALFEIWSGWRCDMKIIFGVFDHLDIKLLSNKIFYSWHGWIIWFWKCILY